MSEIKTGGPAFPKNFGVPNEGMTLRDYFAAKAMQATLTTNDCYPDENWRIGTAMDAYKMADAMPEVRERGNE